MINFIKTLFIKRKALVNMKSIGLTRYPQPIEKIGFFCLDSNFPKANFIKKLKATFGKQTQFIFFTFGDKNEPDDGYLLNNKSFDLFGKIKNPSLQQELIDLDMLIDITHTASQIKQYALSLASHAYKISLGSYENNIYNLSINLKSLDYNLFADEILKYHKILIHEKK